MWAKDLFQPLKRITTYFKGNHNRQKAYLMLLHVQKERVDELSMIDIGDEFGNRVGYRLQILGDFTVADFRPSKTTQTQDLVWNHILIFLWFQKT